LLVLPAIVGGTLAGLFLGALLIALVATRFLGFELLTVRSGSMEPTISRGDLIVVRPVAFDKVTEGDVVLFTAGGDAIPTVHRVAGINEFELRIRDAATGAETVHTERRLVTKGDANPGPDTGEVQAGDVLGTVWFTVPAAGTLVGLPLQHALFAFAAVTVVVWLAWEVHRRRQSTE